MKIMILKDGFVHVKRKGVHLLDMPIDEYFNYFHCCIECEPFRIENDPKLYFVTHRDNSGDKNLNYKFQYPLDNRPPYYSIPYFSKYFVKEEF